MARPTTTLTPGQKRAEKAERVRKVLDAALNSDGQTESDTDVSDTDESDVDTDEAWQWIYETEPEPEAELENGKTPETPSRRQNVREAVKYQQGSKVAVRRRADGLECRIGDCVLLNAPGSKVPWVGMLISFVGRDEDGDECAEFMCKNYPPTTY